MPSWDMLNPSVTQLRIKKKKSPRKFSILVGKRKRSMKKNQSLSQHYGPVLGFLCYWTDIA